MSRGPELHAPTRRSPRQRKGLLCAPPVPAIDRHKAGEPARRRSRAALATAVRHHKWATYGGATRPFPSERDSYPPVGVQTRLDGHPSSHLSGCWEGWQGGWSWSRGTGSTAPRKAPRAVTDERRVPRHPVRCHPRGAAPYSAWVTPRTKSGATADATGSTTRWGGEGQVLDSALARLVRWPGGAGRPIGHPECTRPPTTGWAATAASSPGAPRRARRRPPHCSFSRGEWCGRGQAGEIGGARQAAAGAARDQPRPPQPRDSARADRGGRWWRDGGKPDALPPPAAVWRGAAVAQRRRVIY